MSKAGARLYIPDRGDLIWISLHPTTGHKQSVTTLQSGIALGRCGHLRRDGAQTEQGPCRVVGAQTAT